MAKQRAGPDSFLTKESGERLGIISGCRMLHRQVARLAVARCIPCHYSPARRERVDLPVERARSRADAVQQDHGGAVAPVEEADGHAAAKATACGLGAPTTMLNCASLTPSLRK